MIDRPRVLASWQGFFLSLESGNPTLLKRGGQCKHAPARYCFWKKGQKVLFYQKSRFDPTMPQMCTLLQLPQRRQLIQSRLTVAAGPPRRYHCDAAAHPPGAPATGRHGIAPSAPGAALFQNVLQEGVPVAGLKILLLEAGEGVGREYLSPLVAVGSPPRSRPRRCGEKLCWKRLNAGGVITATWLRTSSSSAGIHPLWSGQRSGADGSRTGRTPAGAASASPPGSCGRSVIFQQIGGQRLPGLVMAGDEGQRLGFQHSSRGTGSAAPPHPRPRR